ncbi:MAG: mercury resistance system transport protein MerF [Candidatus Desulfatibia sp.]|uniref:mercury resistance system transport protein MerF n=1 Tax=Candidatus Desulfatibia sp. TaxID=3101189 RepID=UPI002F326264
MNANPEKSSETSKQWFYTGLTGTILLALCCVGKILLITLGVAGLSAFTPYFYYVLLPALALMIAFTFISYRRWKNG